MTKLEKKAWLELLVVSLSLFLVIPMLYLLASRNAQGLDLVIIMVVSVGITLLVGAMVEKKKFAKYDEREQKIALKTFRWSAYVFVGFVMLTGFGAFFMIGGAGEVCVVNLPVFFLIGIFIAQLSQTAMIVMLCNTESDDE